MFHALWWILCKAHLAHCITKFWCSLIIDRLITMRLIFLISLSMLKSLWLKLKLCLQSACLCSLNKCVIERRVAWMRHLSCVTKWRDWFLQRRLSLLLHLQIRCNLSEWLPKLNIGSLIERCNCHWAIFSTSRHDCINATLWLDEPFLFAAPLSNFDLAATFLVTSCQVKRSFHRGLQILVVKTVDAATLLAVRIWVLKCRKVPILVVSLITSSWRALWISATCIVPCKWVSTSTAKAVVLCRVLWTVNDWLSWILTFLKRYRVVNARLTIHVSHCC